MHSHSARMISFVPSLTETLLYLGYNVIGRTRFCIHPREQIKTISVVGGTKDFKLQDCLDLKPDVVILEQEENRRELYDQLLGAGVKVFVFHVTTLEDLLRDLTNFQQLYGCENLQKFLARVQRVIQNKSKISPEIFFRNCLLLTENQFPSQMQSQAARPDIEAFQSILEKIKNKKKFNYLIWKDPWMGIGKKTFIQQMMSFAGIHLLSEEKYPKLTLEEIQKTFNFLSTEPFPFHNFIQKMNQQNIEGVLIDGEKISWYGIRSLQFLEDCLGEPS